MPCSYLKIERAMIYIGKWMCKVVMCASISSNVGSMFTKQEVRQAYRHGYWAGSV